MDTQSKMTDPWDAPETTESKMADPWDAPEEGVKELQQVTPEQSEKKKGGYLEQVKEGGREFLQSITPDAVLLMFKEGNYFDNVDQYVKEETARVDKDIQTRQETLL